MKNQIIPLLMTFLTFLAVCGMLFCAIIFLNKLPGTTPVLLHLRISDVVVGLTIYLKTSVDFALFIGNLMHKNPGMKNRIAIETGTSIGNALGTIAVLFLWSFFRSVPLLMALMILVASFILLQMAEEGLSQVRHKTLSPLVHLLGLINRYPKLLTAKLLPGTGVGVKPFPTTAALLVFSLSIPFLLGLDDFAGYIPLFSVVNIFGFSIGVFSGHMLLTGFLFLSPKKTTALVKHPSILLSGSMALIGIALIGFFEVIKLF